MTHGLRRASRLVLLATTVAALAACGGGGDAAPPPHDHPHLETAGRLAVLADGANAVHMVDLDDKSIAQTFALGGTPSAVYASPGQRYAVVLQRTDDLTRFIDGGIYQEDHVDHLHDYKVAPRLLNFSVAGSRPTHYETHDDGAALFLDGQDATAENAEAVLLSDAGIGAGRIDARLSLERSMHGTAEPRGNYLLTTWRAADAASTLPSHVELYRRNGTGYDFVQRFAQECPGLHGSYSNEDHSAFGCTDGVLVITQAGDTFTASKIANPADIGTGVRIGTLAGHHHVGNFIGIAAPGHLFDIDPVAGTIARITWADGRTQRAHSFDAAGENFLVLDDLGVLHLLDAEDHWNVRATLNVIDTMPTAAPFPAIAVSSAQEQAFVSDPLGRRIAVVDLHGASVVERITLTFAPTSLAWLGIAEHHAHD